MAQSAQRKVVYTIVESRSDQPDAKGFWVRIGSAFMNRDGSINVLLDAFPVNGRLHIRDPAPKDEQGHGQREPQRAAPYDSRGGYGGRR
jgi:hypothetical protein